MQGLGVQRGVAWLPRDRRDTVCGICQASPGIYPLETSSTDGAAYCTLDPATYIPQMDSQCVLR